MDNCIFCKIIKGEIPSYKIYENDKVYAFLDISDDMTGHTLVIPKKHSRNIFDTNKEDLEAVIDAVQEISKHYKDLGYDGVNILNANEPSAEQSVFHLHFHILPRKNGDGKKVYPVLDKQNNNLKEVAKFFKLEK